MRFELGGEMIAALKGGAALKMGSRHESYSYTTEVGEDIRRALLADLS